MGYGELGGYTAMTSVATTLCSVGRGMIFTNELGRIWKETAMAQFGVLSRYFPGRTEENQRRLQGSLCSGRNSNWSSPE
jgi:hypothetical protein